MLSTESSNMLDREYVSADLFVVYASVIIGIFACKTVHKKHHFISCVSIAFFISYSSLIFRCMNLASLLVPFTSKAIITSQRAFSSNGATGELIRSISPN